MGSNGIGGILLLFVIPLLSVIIVEQVTKGAVNEVVPSLDVVGGYLVHSNISVGSHDGKNQRRGEG